MIDTFDKGFNKGFDVGDRVVFPAHGAGVIEDVATREVLGETNEYLKLALVRGDMQIMVPVDQGREVGLRPAIDEDEIARVKDAMADARLRLPKSWPARNRKEQEILDTGGAYDLARLIGVLARRDFEKGLPTTERHTLRTAKSLLASELALVRGVPLDEAASELDETVAALAA